MDQGHFLKLQNPLFKRVLLWANKILITVLCAHFQRIQITSLLHVVINWDDYHDLNSLEHLWDTVKTKVNISVKTDTDTKWNKSKYEK